MPGLAKTLMIRTLADALNLTFSRIQFTPDLMPSDITGTEVIQEDTTTGQRVFKFLHGPIFANVVLADEINRTPPKTQAALLEAMQERQVTVGGDQAQAARAVLRAGDAEPDRAGRHLSAARGAAGPLHVQHHRRLSRTRTRSSASSSRRPPARIRRRSSGSSSADDLCEMQDIVRKVPVAPYVIRYAMKFTRLTRKEKGEVPDFIQDYVTWGAGPGRASS